MQSTFPDPGGDADRAETYPALARLRLEAADWESLARQGFIAEEQRSDRRYWKLRFRRGGRQRVRYIGDDDQAREVQSELDNLQRATRAQRRLQQITKWANSVLRDFKREAQPTLTQYGYQFHGLTLRKSRAPDSRQPDLLSQSLTTNSEREDHDASVEPQSEQ